LWDSRDVLYKKTIDGFSLERTVIAWWNGHMMWHLWS